MNRRELRVAKLMLSLAMAMLMVAASVVGAAAKEAPLITKEELKAQLGTAGLTVIDVRRGNDWTDSDKKIQGAVREEPDKVSEWAKKYTPDQKLVLYCA